MAQTITVPGVGDLEFPDGMSDAAMAAAIQKNYPQIHGQQAAPTSPSQGLFDTIKQLGGGYLNFAGTALRHPVGAIEQGLHFAGQSAGALGGGLAVVGTALKGGDIDEALANQKAVQQALTYTPRTDAGKQIADYADKALGLIPQALNKAGDAAYNATGSPLIGAAVPTVGNALMQGLGLRGLKGVGAAAGAAEDAAATMPRPAPTTPAELLNQSLGNGKQQGYITTPNYDPLATTADKFGMGIAGKANVEQGARVSNQGVTNALAARSVGLPPASLITNQVLQGIRQAAIDKGYAPIAELDGPISADSQFLKNNSAIKQQHADELSGNPDVAATADILNKSEFDPAKVTDQISTLRSRANEAYAAGRPAAGSAFKQQASELEALVDRHLQDQDGLPPDLLTNYRAARQLIAKTHTVGEHLNPSTGNVDATGIGSAYKNGAPLTGDLKTIADFANSASGITSVPNGAPLPTSPLNTAAGMAAAHATGGLSMAAIPAIRMFAGNWLLKHNQNPALLQPANKTFGASALDAIHGNSKAFAQLYGQAAPGAAISTDPDQ